MSRMKPAIGIRQLLQPELEQVQRVRRHLGVRLPDRHRVDELLPVAAHGHADRAGVRDGHRDGVDPRDALDLEAIDQAEHRLREGLPPEVGLEAGQQQERLAELVVGQVQLEGRRLVVGQVVLVEVDDRTARTVVEQDVRVEGGDHLAVERPEQVGAELTHSGTRIGEAGQARDKGEPLRHFECRIQLEQLAGVTHRSTLERTSPDDAADSPRRERPQRTPALGSRYDRSHADRDRLPHTRELPRCRRGRRTSRTRRRDGALRCGPGGAGAAAAPGRILGRQG